MELDQPSNLPRKQLQYSHEKGMNLHFVSPSLQSSAISSPSWNPRAFLDSCPHYTIEKIKHEFENRHCFSVTRESCPARPLKPRPSLGTRVKWQSHRERAWYFWKYKLLWGILGYLWVDWWRDSIEDSRTQYIHEIEESLSLTNHHFNCCIFNKWKIVKNHKQTITSRSNKTFVCWRSISWMLVVRHKTTAVHCFNSKNSISILTPTTKVELKRQRQKL